MIRRSGVRVIRAAVHLHGGAMSEQDDNGADETSEPTTTPDQSTPPASPANDASSGLKEDLAKERKARQALERQAGQLQKELESIRQSQMSEQDKAVAEAETRGRQSALSEVGKRLAAAELGQLLAPLVPDSKARAALIANLDLSRYITESGEFDEAAGESFAKTFGAMVPKPGAPAVPTGARGGGQDPDPGSMPMPEYLKWRKANAGA